ncbi:MULTISPECIES: LemA family protein [unclassified Streptococcus]|uniref:LemA family protein n=1 Tax=unclassified Streptococcus TaxID=2608887 RepID=UPI001072A963|nr:MULTISPECIES: LemA family protein [unclassified Streptococcus]MBF0786487.1 LemA family protein [Streptococcus sp. 19428wC2_LYSM12]MCQ9212357.1 LemA family protein [Streptococcus sp. B01]MCQ9213688.1 LemA family protein [Streptococcus sp. O1]TFV06651.1 LemA family protein [Streptococcus sp. LYSM12]
MNKKLLYILIPVLAIVFIAMGAIGQYNGLVDSYAEVENAQSNVDTQLQRRYDLIPNVVASVKGAMEHETEVFTAIADARAKIGSSKQGSAEYKEGQSELDSAVSRLLVLTENYPQLNSNQQVSDLITELEGTENRLLVARKDYNTIATAYNKKIKRFPTSIYAGIFGYEKVDLFQATSEATTTVPSVNLGDK